MIYFRHHYSQGGFELLTGQPISLRVVRMLHQIAMLFVMFKVFLMLLIAYVTIIILTIFAPFLLLVQALPGNNGAREWFRQLAANIVIFPAVAVMFLLAGILSGIPNLGGTGSSTIDPGNIGQFPLLSGGLQLENIGSLVGFGLLLMTPSAAKMVKDRIGIKEGAGFGAGAAAFGAAAGLAGRRVAGSAPAQAVAGLRQYQSERASTAIINKAPPFLRGGAELERNYPTYSKKPEEDDK